MQLTHDMNKLSGDDIDERLILIHQVRSVETWSEVIRLHRPATNEAIFTDGKLQKHATWWQYNALQHDNATEAEHK